MRNQLMGAVAAGVVLTLGAAACGSGTGGGRAGVVTIATAGPLTGSNSPQLGINIRNGVQLAVDEYNAGHPKVRAVFRYYDTKGDPAVAKEQARRIIADHVTALVGPTFSGESKATGADFEAARIPMISPSATNTSLGRYGWRFWHRVMANDDVQGQVDGDFISRTLGARKVFIVDDGQEYGIGLANRVDAQLRGSGVIAQREMIDPRAADYSQTVARVRAAAPQAVFFGGYYNGADRLLRQLRDAGVRARFVSDDGALDESLIKAAGSKQAEGALLSCACQSISPALSSPAVAQFVAAYRARFGVDQGTYSAEGYDAANIILDAVKAGDTTGEQINGYLAKVEYRGVSKFITFDSDGELADGQIFIFEVRAGRLTFLGGAATARPNPVGR